jgi:hypothetical protein
MSMGGAVTDMNGIPYQYAADVDPANSEGTLCTYDPSLIPQIVEEYARYKAEISAQTS